MREAILEARMYLSSVLGLLSGREVFVPKNSAGAPKALPKGTSDARTLELLELGKAELAAEHDGLERVRGRAQFMLTTGLALLGIGVGAIPLSRDLLDGPAVVWWAVGVAALILGVLGAASVVTAQKRMGVVSTREVAANNPRAGGLVLMFIDAVAVSRDTRAAAITVFRDAVLLDLLGTASLSIAYLVAFLPPVPKVGL